MPETKPLLTPEQKRELRELQDVDGAFDPDYAEECTRFMPACLATIEALRADVAAHRQFLEDLRPFAPLSRLEALLANPNPGQALLNRLHELDEDWNNLTVERDALQEENAGFRGAHKVMMGQRDDLAAENTELKEDLSLAHGHITNYADKIKLLEAVNARLTRALYETEESSADQFERAEKLEEENARLRERLGEAEQAMDNALGGLCEVGHGPVPCDRGDWCKPCTYIRKYDPKYAAKEKG